MENNKQIASLLAVSALLFSCAQASVGARNDPGLASASDGAVRAPGGPNTATCSWRVQAPVTLTTPFAAPDNSLTFTPPSIPCTIFSITDFGAKGDGISSNTFAFAQAVAAAVAAGGGVVLVPPGSWLTGAIHLASSIELHIEAGATVLFSQNFDDYLPPVLTRWEGLDVINWSPLIYAIDATNVAITGTGTLDGQGSVWAGWRQSSKAELRRMYEHYVSKLPLDSAAMPAPPTSTVINGLRPTFVECNHCANVLIDGLSITGSPFWTLHPLYSTNVIIRNIHVDTATTDFNGDGIDIDSSTNVLVESSTFATSDDCIGIKSGLNEVGIARNRPSRNIVIRKINSTLGHAGVAIGSEMSGGVSNVFVTDSNLMGLERPIRIKTMPGRGGAVHDLWFVDGLTLGWSVAGIEITTQYPTSTIPSHNPDLVPTLSRMTFRGITGSGTGPVYSITGPLSDLSLHGVTLTGSPGTCSQASNVSTSGCALTGLARDAVGLACDK